MVTLVDRKSKYLEGDKLNRRSAEETIKTMINLLGKHELKKNLTITLDNGKEFS
jgi:IS30 family transposase